MLGLTVVVRHSVVVVTVTDGCCFRLNGCYEALSGGYYCL